MGATTVAAKLVGPPKGLAAWLLILPSAALSQPGDAPDGARAELTLGRLFTPAGFAAPDGQVHLILHLHGAHWAAEQNLIRSGERAVLVSIVLPGLSDIYRDALDDPEVFPRLLGEVEAQLRAQGVAETPVISRLTVTSFSAGFGGVRELLRQEAAYARIDTLVMADSIHAGFVGDPAERNVNPDHMAAFVRFARDAAEGRKVMLVTHSEIRPEGYASTTETAEFLLRAVGGEAEPVDETWEDGLHCTSRFARGGLIILGFAGETGPDHMQHLHSLWRLMQEAHGSGSTDE